MAAGTQMLILKPTGKIVRQRERVIVKFGTCTRRRQPPASGLIHAPQRQANGDPALDPRQKDEAPEQPINSQPLISDAG